MLRFSVPVLLAALAVSCQSSTELPFSNGHIFTEATQNDFGDALTYPSGKAAFTNDIKVWKPEFVSPWYFHPFYGTATILQGTLTIEYDRETPADDSGGTKTATDTKVYTAGDSFMSVVDTWHQSSNRGSEPFVFIVSWMGEEGQPLTYLHED